MLERIYLSLWGLCILTVGLFYMTGNLTLLAAIVFGFIVFGLTFMGMIGVLPFYATHHTHTKH